MHNHYVRGTEAYSAMEDSISVAREVEDVHDSMENHLEDLCAHIEGLSDELDTAKEELREIENELGELKEEKSWGPQQTYISLIVDLKKRTDEAYDELGVHGYIDVEDENSDCSPGTDSNGGTKASVDEGGGTG